MGVFHRVVSAAFGRERSGVCLGAAVPRVPTQNSECRRNSGVYCGFGVLSRDTDQLFDQEQNHGKRQHQDKTCNSVRLVDRRNNPIDRPIDLASQLGNLISSGHTALRYNSDM
jgi:hypothetical protein